MATERLTTGHPARIRYQHPGHVRMLIGDAYIAIRFLRETPRRIAGLPTDASFLTTLFAIGVLATALRRIAAPALRVFRPRHPSFAGTMIAGARRRGPSRRGGIRRSAGPRRLGCLSCVRQRVRAYFVIALGLPTCASVLTWPAGSPPRWSPSPSSQPYSRDPQPADVSDSHDPHWLLRSTLKQSTQGVDHATWTPPSGRAGRRPWNGCLLGQQARSAGCRERGAERRASAASARARAAGYARGPDGREDQSAGSASR